MWRTIRSAIVPVCKRYVLGRTKDPLVRVVEQLVLILLGPFDIVLRIHDVELSTVRCLDIIPTGVLARRDKNLKRLINIAAELRLYFLAYVTISPRKASV